MTDDTTDTNTDTDRQPNRDIPAPMYPDPPDALPTWITDQLRTYADDADVLAAIQTYAETLHEWTPPADPAAVDVSDVGPEGKVVDVRSRKGWTDVIKKIDCGKDVCNSCPHGPYHYRAKRDGDDVEWEYVSVTESDIVDR